MTITTTITRWLIPFNKEMSKVADIVLNFLDSVTTGQAIVAPIIENTDQIYPLDISQGQEAEDTNQQKAEIERL